LQCAEKALYTVSPLEKAYLRETESERKLRQSIAKLDADIAVQTPELARLYQAYQAEQEKEPQRESLTAAIDSLAKMIPRYEAAERLKKELQALSKEQTALQEALDTLERQKLTLTEKEKATNEKFTELADAERQLSACEQVSQQLMTANAGLRNLQTAYAALSRLQGERKQIQTQFLDAEVVFQTAAAVYTEKEAAFYHEQAGILASSLQDGVPCPVCGAAEHPHKAAPTAGAPDAKALQAAKQARELADKKMQTIAEKAAAKQAEINLSERHFRQSAAEMFPVEEGTARLEHIADQIGENLSLCEHQQKENEEKGEHWQAQCALKKRCQETLISLAQKRKTLEETVVMQEQRRSEFVAAAAAKSGELKAVQAGFAYPDRKQAAAAGRKLTDQINLLKAALQDSEKAYYAHKSVIESNRTLLVDQKERLSAAAELKAAAQTAYAAKRIECGFDSEASYHGALKTKQECDAMTLSIEQYRDAVKTVKQDLLRLSKETEQEQRQDMEQLEATRKNLEIQKRRADESLQVVAARLGSNEPVEKELVRAMKEAEARESEYLLVSGLSKTANGELAGRQKLAFEQYVQASYFHQILAQANKRLSVMTGERFSLLRGEESKNLRSQTGLEIDVLDLYTGRVRSVKTLSGGESFKASLALALGLSDVIQSYAGGVEIDALFIDEGFGALDAESLEHAIQTLVHLASGQRLIGIISHVNELKERIDRQVVVQKSPMGSRISIV
jgi:exonuclease SbcC